MNKLTWIKSLIIVVFSLIVFGCVIALATHQWKDCLEENSWFTCARMLNK
jgi:uncharacterized membrane protein YhaH (DUF805 family)